MRAIPLAPPIDGDLVAPRLNVYRMKAALLFQANVNDGRPYIQVIRLRQLGEERYPIATIVDGLCVPEGLALDKIGTPLRRQRVQQLQYNRIPARPNDA